eukprot:COSAG02_NODE_1666_length_11424_cov_5.733245_8_plen_174_part_00
MQVGDDEYQNDQLDESEKKKDLGALEAAKMAIKFLDQVPKSSHLRALPQTVHATLLAAAERWHSTGAQAIAKMRKRRRDTGLQIEYDTNEIAYIDKEIAWLREKQGRIARAQAERQQARDKIALEVEHCVAGFQTMITNARNLNRTGGKGAKQIMAGRHVPKGLPHISNRENV